MLDETPAMRIPLNGLSCAGCVARAERAIGAVPEVRSVEVNLATGTAQVVADPGALPEIAAAAREAGYPPATRRVRLTLEGMHCGSCAARIEDALGRLPGVSEAHVNLAANRADVDVIEGTAQETDLLAAVAEAGYRATIAPAAAATEQSEDSADAETRRLARQTLIAGLLALPVFLLEMGSHVLPPVREAIAATIGVQGSWLIQFVLTTAILAGPGRHFYVTGLPALLRGGPDMNALVALGTGAAWGYSTVALFAPGLLPEGTRHVYFEAAAVIVTLILLGRWLEARAKGRTGAAVRRLIGLQPQTARVVRDGAVTEIPLSDLRAGDLINVRPGDRIAADGTVRDGTGHVDESMLTGEPAPVRKAPGAKVSAGTVNGNAVLTVEAREVGEATALARIVAMVEEAQGARLPIQSLVNRVTLYFVPAVMAVAAATVLAWLAVGPAPALTHALVAGVAVLIVACPCAMGLATPTSIMVGTGRAAEAGILFRGGSALQGLQAVRTVAFDKTGTLTEGRPDVTDVVPLALSDADLRVIAASVEAQSEHPIGRAVVAAAERAGAAIPQAHDVKAATGKGIEGMVDGRRVVLGNMAMMAEAGLAAEDFGDAADRFAEAGQTVIFCAVDGAAAGALAVSDPVKPSARAAIADLKAAGLSVAMVTGDSRAVADAVASDLGIDRVFAEVLPEAKSDAVETLRRDGPVAFVGDGINDAPALARADVGIAIGTGTDVAIEAGDVVLMAGDPARVATAFDLSRRTLRNIRQNLVWAFGYNTALIPVAAGVLYPLNGTLLSPMLAAGAMALSSVFVLTNALRLRRAPIPQAAR